MHGQCVICGYVEAFRYQARLPAPRRERTPPAVFKVPGEWRCRVPGCAFVIQYRHAPSGRQIAKHRREAHGQ